MNTNVYSDLINNASTHNICRLEKGFSFRLAALLGLSAIIRSNGLISLGFIVYKGMRVIGKGKFIILFIYIYIVTYIHVTYIHICPQALLFYDLYRF